ncbi:MAG: hypothetical protein KC933_01655 [Myxococcales bacterium]|nr:hypothetical protein [Myxococcales bacterium]MCB9648477.1 hypothetical protein [Deltaproteobacteria bacterium]
MRGLGICKLAFMISTLGLGGCWRSVPDLPDRPEGALAEGQVVSRAGALGDWAPTAGVAVTVAGLGLSGSTDDDGIFSLARLPVNHLLTLSITAPRREPGPVRRRVLSPRRALLDGEKLDYGALQLGPGGTLRGRALLRATGAAEPTGQGGVLVVLAQTAFKAVTDEGGAFQLPGVPEGDFELVAFSPGYLPARLERVPVLPGGTVTAQDLVLEAGEAEPRLVSGLARILGADVHDGITVRFEGEGAAPATAEAITGADGAYSVTLPPGVYHVTAAKDGFGKVLLQGVAVLPEGVLGLVEIYLVSPLEGDFDGDGIPDDRDEDDDNDGCVDVFDAFPLDPSGCTDSDGDGISDELDDDDDDDGLPDAEEVTEGADGWVTSPIHADTDGDGVNDRDDVCPTVPDDQTDSNGDGVGDACQVVTPGNNLSLPVITRFEPTEAGVGQAVTIYGANLDDPIHGDQTVIVRFGPSAPVNPIRILPDLLEVLVPNDATSGTIRVYSRGAITSTGTFSLRPTPTVAGFSPQQGRRGSRVVVIGHGFLEDGIGAFVNGVQANLLPFDSGALVETRVYAGQAYDTVQLQVPDTTTGLVEITNRFGSGASTASFVVTDAGVVIQSVTPNPTPLNGQISLIGHGFSTSDLVDPATPEVIFDYGGAEVRQPLNPGWTDVLATVMVPPGAMTGQIALVHPAADQPVVYGQILQIDPLLPYLTGSDPELIMVGDTLTLSGGNLLGATRVEFAGGVAVTGAGLVSTAATVELTVPPGVQPGPVTVTTARGSAVTPFRLGVVTMTPGAVTGSFGSGGGFGVGGDEFYALGNRAVYVMTGTAAVPRLLRTVDLAPILPAGVQVVTLRVAPSGAVAVVATNSAGTWILSPPSFALVGVCPFSSNGVGTDVLFDDTTSAAYFPEPTNTTDSSQFSVVRIDLVSGTCEEILLPPVGATATVNGILPQNGTLLLTSAAGAAVLEVDPSSPLYGTLTTPWTGPAYGIGPLRPGPGGLVYFTGSPSQGAGYYEPFSGQPPTYLPQTQRSSWVLVDGLGRYLVSQSGVNSYIVDMAAAPPHVVRRGMDINQIHGASKLGAHTFILRQFSGSNPPYVRMDIQP